MPADPPIMPFLNPDDWRGRTQCACRRLLAIDAPGVPVLAFGIDLPDRVEYLMTTTLRERRYALETVEAEALRNLRTRADRAPWRVETVETGDGGTVSFLAREGDAFTASDILDVQLMREAHEHFGSEAVMIGIPGRTMMIASEDPIGLAGLVAEMHETARENGDGVSPLIFLLDQGELQGIGAQEAAGGGLDDAEDADADEVDDEDEEEQDEDDDSEDDEEAITWERPAPRVLMRDGQRALVLQLSCEDADECARAMAYELDACAGSLERFEFDGPIVFAVVGDWIGDSAARATVEEVASRYDQAAKGAGLVTSSARPVSVAVAFVHAKGRG